MFFTANLAFGVPLGGIFPMHRRVAVSAVANAFRTGFQPHHHRFSDSEKPVSYLIECKRVTKVAELRS